LESFSGVIPKIDPPSDDMVAHEDLLGSKANIPGASSDSTPDLEMLGQSHSNEHSELIDQSNLKPAIIEPVIDDMNEKPKLQSVIIPTNNFKPAYELDSGRYEGTDFEDRWDLDEEGGRLKNYHEAIMFVK